MSATTGQTSAGIGKISGATAGICGKTNETSSEIDGRMIGPTWREIGKISSGIEWTCAGIGRMSTTTVQTSAGIGKISGATAGTFMRIGTIAARIFNNNEE